MKKPFSKIIRLLIYLALITPLLTNAQLRFDYTYKTLDTASYILSYNHKYILDSTDPKRVRNVDMILLIGKNVSLFIEEENFKADTIKRKFKNSNDLKQYMRDPKAPLPKFFHRIYKNYPNGKLTFVEDMIGGTFKFEENLDMFNWNVEKDTMTIAGYKAQKASCEFGGRSWIAWFTPEIPFNDGPYKFNGLPGLILKVVDEKGHYDFEFISIYKPSKTVYIDMKEKDYIESTKMEFFKAKDNFREDIINRAKEAGLDSGAQQKAARALSKRNNPIELIRK